MMEVENFSQSQIKQIEEGREAGLDVSVYAKPEYAAMHMRQIRLGDRCGACDSSGDGCGDAACGSRRRKIECVRRGCVHSVRS